VKLWEVRGAGKAFVDLQNDVTAQDVRLAQREGYEHVEHMKRYTTHGMATDQGRIGGLTGSGILAEARGVTLAEVGLPRPRPYAQPVPFAALAGGEVREHYKPKRRLPLHDWHEAAGASFVCTGLWLRPLVYSRAGGWDAVLPEARTVRTQVGITDVSTLGKIDVQGPDAARFLDFIYANTFSTLPVGRARYGIMLREDGMLFDDGTTTRLASEHFLVTTTTANAAAVLEHLEFQLQANCPGLQVNLTDVADQWAQFAVAGPRSREVLSAALPELDLSNEGFPFMAAMPVRIADIPARLFRISFSGELAYELAVPAQHARRVWTRLLLTGEPHGIRPYGLDALNTLRIEKGHITGAELNGNTSAADLGFQRMLKKQGDFIGRALSQRSGMLATDRLQLVGVRPTDHGRRLRNGTQVVSTQARQQSLGYITSSTPSVELDGWVGLALVSGGRQRIGTRLAATSPVHGESYEIELVSPHMIDAENARVRA
jgi:sarcosine oxidase subunit alpha